MWTVCRQGSEGWNVILENPRNQQTMDPDPSLQDCLWVWHAIYGAAITDMFNASFRDTSIDQNGSCRSVEKQCGQWLPVARPSDNALSGLCSLQTILAPHDWKVTFYSMLPIPEKQAFIFCKFPSLRSLVLLEDQHVNEYDYVSLVEWYWKGKTEIQWCLG